MNVCMFLIWIFLSLHNIRTTAAKTFLQLDVFPHQHSIIHKFYHLGLIFPFCLQRYHMHRTKQSKFLLKALYIISAASFQAINWISLWKWKKKNTQISSQWAYAMLYFRNQSLFSRYAEIMYLLIYCNNNFIFYIQLYMF